MKVITLKQPWATLVAEGIKEYEFRSWKTNYRGKLLIHAGSGIDKEEMKKFEHQNLEDPSKRIIAEVELIDCLLLDEKIKSTKSFGKPHLFSIMQTLGNFNREEYYRNMDNLDTSHLKLDAKRVITSLNGSCKVILAHPCEVMDEYNFNFVEIEKFIKYLKDLGLTGLKTYYSNHTKEMQEKFSMIAKKYNLEENYGSDFHGEHIKPGLNIGDIYKK